MIEYKVPELAHRISRYTQEEIVAIIDTINSINSKIDSHNSKMAELEDAWMLTQDIPDTARILKQYHRTFHSPYTYIEEIMLGNIAKTQYPVGEWRRKAAAKKRELAAVD